MPAFQLPAAALSEALREALRDLANVAPDASDTETATAWELQQLRAELRDRNRAYGRASDTIGRLRGECARLHGRVDGLTEGANALAAQVDKLTADRDRLRDRVDKLTAEAIRLANLAATTTPPAPSRPLAGIELLRTLIELILPTYGAFGERTDADRLDAQDEAVYIAEHMRRRGLTLVATGEATR